MENSSEMIADNPIVIERRSLYSDATQEVDRHKWILSQQAGRDLGDEAICDWVARHWHGFLRARWLEHLQGFRFWLELERSYFGILRRQFPDNEPLLDTILGKLKKGQENLDVLVWATERDLPMPIIHDILEAIDINRIRLLEYFRRAA
jgi:hypothetical protein